MRQHKYVKLLLTKAAQDEYVLDKLIDDREAPDEIFGFHAQQAAEKILKAILAHHTIKYPFTHRLEELLDLASSKGINVPSEFEELRYLTPFAVEFRYDVIPGEEEAPVDKGDIREMLKTLRAWVEQQISTEAD